MENRFRIAIELAAYRESLRGSVPNRVERRGRIPETHRQILCHVSWHLKQMRGSMLTRIVCDCVYDDVRVTIA